MLNEIIGHQWTNKALIKDDGFYFTSHVLNKGIRLTKVGRYVSNGGKVLTIGSLSMITRTHTPPI